MRYELVSQYSSCLNREMKAGIYGHSGKIMIAFAAQDGKNNNYADFGMIEQLSPWIESGRLMVVTPDSIDEETWSNKNGDPAYRAWLNEQWYYYVMNELIPMVQYKFNNYDKMMTTGCSMGGYHATNFMLRRPDLFDTVISLSGCYKSDYFFGDYMDETLYNSSPVDFIRGMSSDHPYIELYNQSNIIICAGQGAWEDELLISNRELNVAMKEKGINAWFDYWGFDVNHDWPWWKLQIVYFMKKVLGE